MGGYLSNTNSLSNIQANPAIMSALGRAMYQIRAPQKSTRVPYESLNAGQKRANQDKAFEVLSATISSTATDPNQAIESMAQHLYSQLAPQKSQIQPWHTRSEFHHAWYVKQATSFVMLVQETFELPGKAEAPTARRLDGGDVTNESALSTAKGISGRIERDSLQSIAPSEEELRALQQHSGETLDQLGDESMPSAATYTEPSDLRDAKVDNDGKFPAEQTTIGTNPLTGPLYLIAFLLFLLILAIVIF